MNEIDKINEQKRLREEAAQAQKALQTRLADPSYGDGSMLARPQDTSIQGASEDFMDYLQNPTFNMENGAENDAIIKAANPDRVDFDALKGNGAPDLAPVAPISASQNIRTSMKGSISGSSNGGSTSSDTPPTTTPQEDILSQLKAARDANAASLANARQSDKMTELGNLIMKSGSMVGEGLVNQSGNTKIKLDAAQSAADESKFAGEGAKSKLEALMQDYGIKKGIEDTAYNKKKDEQARLDRLSDKAEDRKFKLDMLKAKTDTKTPPVSEFDKALKKSVGNQSADWVLKDRSQIQNDIAKLKEVEAALQDSVDGKGENVSGPVIGRLWGQDFVNEKGYELQNTIDQVTQKNLKDILGGQFAQQEGQDLLKRGYDPKKKEAYNLKNVIALREAMEESFLRKDEAVKSLSEGDSTKDFIQNVQGINRSQQSSYPKKLSNGKGKTATVSNAQEEAEARSEGWN